MFIFVVVVVVENVWSIADSLINLDVCFGNADPLWEDLGDVEILNFIPGIVRFILDMNLVGSIFRRAFMANVCEEIVLHTLTFIDVLG